MKAFVIECYLLHVLHCYIWLVINLALWNLKKNHLTSLHASNNIFSHAWNNLHLFCKWAAEWVTWIRSICPNMHPCGEWMNGSLLLLGDKCAEKYISVKYSDSIYLHIISICILKQVLSEWVHENVWKYRQFCCGNRTCFFSRLLFGLCT